MAERTSIGAPGKRVVPNPSASVMLLDPTNELLLLHRVQTSTAFPSAHVFPGGGLSEHHEQVPAVDSPARHIDGPAYRLAAIRETFEESGILLALTATGQLLNLPDDVREEGRKAIHGDKVRFTEWVKSVGGIPDVDGLMPFTRWITPTTLAKRFTTQMYVYMLPLSSNLRKESIVPTHDGGLEHTAATFAPVRSWLDRSASGEIILFSPQLFLVTLLGQIFTGGTDYVAQRQRLVKFLNTTPTGPSGHATSSIPWKDKVISPARMPHVRADGRFTLRLDHPGPELAHTARGGDWDRVAIIRSTKRGPTDNEIRWRRDVVDSDGKPMEIRGAKL